MEFIPISKPTIGQEEIDSVSEQVKSGWISMGKRVQEFENTIQEHVGVKHAVAMSNGTATLHAALLALGVGPGDEVLVPSLSYISSANAVLFCGAQPVFVEENENTFTVDPAEFAKKTTSRTKVIMGVDLKGMPSDFDALNALSMSCRIPVLADSAESFGAKYKNKLVGSQALVHSFSMFANKNITTGEGGFITTNDDTVADLCRCIRNQGQAERYHHVMIGHNYRMTDVTAAIGIPQLKRIEHIMHEKNKIAQQYNEAFKDHPLITIPHLPGYVTRHSWYMYCIRVHETVERDDVTRLMTEKGVDFRLSFPPIPLQPVYRQLYGYRAGDFPRAENIFNSFIDIPCWAGMNKEHVDRVIEVVKKSVEQSALKKAS